MILYFCVVSILEDISITSLERFEWDVKIDCCKDVLELVSLCNSQINSLRITNYLVSSYVLTAICHSVSVCVLLQCKYMCGLFIW